MNPGRSSKVAVASCGTFVLAIWVVGSLIVLSSAGVERAGTVPTADRCAPTPTAGAEAAGAREATATSSAVVANAEVATAAEPVTQTAADTTAAPNGPKPIAVAALPDSSQKQSLETPAAQVATAAEPVTQTTADTTAAPDKPEPIVAAALSILRRSSRSKYRPCRWRRPPNR